MCRSGSRQESVANRKSNIPPSRTQAIGTRALISQLMRSQGNSGSFDSAAGAESLAPFAVEPAADEEAAPEYSVLKNPVRERVSEGTATPASVRLSGLVSPRGSGISV